MFPTDSDPLFLTIRVGTFQKLRIDGRIVKANAFAASGTISMKINSLG
jgi:hypothetical protein